MGEGDLDLALGSDLAPEGVPVKMVEGEALGNPTVDLLGLSFPDGAGAGEFGSRASLYFQTGLICLAVRTRLRVAGAPVAKTTESSTKPSTITVLLLKASPVPNRSGRFVCDSKEFLSKL